MSRLAVVSPRRAYVALVVVLFVLMVGQTINHIWSPPDIWAWLGSVREFAARPGSPRHPLVSADAPDLYMGPYSWVLGFISHLTGLDPLWTLAIAGLANALVVFGGLWYFARSLSSRPWVPVWLLAFTLLAWGWSPWRWSGYMNLNSIGAVLPLGSTFAVGGAAYFLGWWWRWLSGDSRRHLVASGLWFGVVILSHQVTGSWALVVALGFLVTRRSLNRRQIRDLLVAAALVAAVAIAWPFYPILGLFSGAGEFDDINMATYRKVLERTVLAWPGLLLLVQRIRRQRQDPVAWAALAVGLVFLGGWLTSAGSIGRVLPGLMLMAHFAMADWLAQQFETLDSAPRRRHLSLAVALLLVAGAASTSMGWLRSVPRAWVPNAVAERLQLDSVVDQYRGLRSLLSEDDVVAAAPRAQDPIGGYAAKVVGVGLPQPFMDDADRREADEALIIDSNTTNETRSELIRRYGVTALVVESDAAEALLRAIPGAQVIGEVNNLTVIRLTL